MTLSLPASLAAMHEDPALMQGVFALVQKLDGSKMVAGNWAEARQYAQALTMAAVARGDYVVLMHDLWDAVFSSVAKLGTIEQDPSDHYPKFIWDGGTLGKTVRLHKELGSASRLRFYVEYELEEGDVYLSVGAFNKNDEQVSLPEFLAQPDGWQCRGEAGWEHHFLFTERFRIENLPETIGKMTFLASRVVDACKGGS